MGGDDFKTEFNCNGCNNTIQTVGIVGKPIRIEDKIDYYPISIVMGCPKCNLIIGKRLILTDLSEKDTKLRGGR